ncbi:MAG: transporter substrate-binding domain-containing protein [Bacteroidales bacterium]|nr:transporter substrate-binding domain-containing protein [Bacteroidales bacterium]
MNQILAGNDPQVKYRIHEIQERGKLIATTDFNSTDYFIYRGEPMGFQYEKLKMFADYLGVDLEISVANSFDEAFLSLEEGRSDLIAMGLTVTRDRAEKVDFTLPLLQTRQMLVQRKPDNWRRMRTWDDIEKSLIRNPIDLAGKTVRVQKSSAHSERLENLSEEIGWPILIVEDPALEVEQLVEAVSNGDIEYTVCDEHMAGFFEKQYPELDIRTPISFPQHIAWAVRQDSDSLLIAINEWLSEDKDSYASKHLIDKYFNSSRTAFMAKSEAVYSTGKKISQYDEILRNISKQHDFDWRLVASLVYQESQFKPEVRSWAGAFGLMQMMPATAKLLGIDSTATEFEQIEAGILYLKILDRELPDDISDPDERVKFILAAYNLGIAHVFDARRLAEKNGKDPNVWSDNVDYYVLNKSNPAFYRDSVVRYGYARGEETYNFVQEVLDRFEHYKNVVTD